MRPASVRINPGAAAEVSAAAAGVAREEAAAVRAAAEVAREEAAAVRAAAGTNLHFSDIYCIQALRILPGMTKKRTPVRFFCAFLHGHVFFLLLPASRH